MVRRTDSDPNPMTDAPKKVLTLNEILEGLSELATNGEGAQRSQAYRMLLGQGGSQVMLPDPIDQSEIVQKLARLMKPAGSRLCQLAFHECFKKKSLNDDVTVQADDLDLEGVKLVTTLRALYKVFPEIKKGGFPKGYPAGRSLEAKDEWCKQEHKKMLLDRKQKELDRARNPEPEPEHVPEPSWFRTKAKDEPTEAAT